MNPLHLTLGTTLLAGLVLPACHDSSGLQDTTTLGGITSVPGQLRRDPQ